MARLGTAGTRRLAVVGCGAVAEVLHFPALKRNRLGDLAAVVDPDGNRARHWASQLGVPRVCADHRELLDLGVDGAIVTAPTPVHCEIGVDLLRAGIHVLLEKPMARSTEECDALVAAAEEGVATLGVSMPRRFYHQCHFAKQAIDSGMLGEVRSFDVRDGYAFSWPLKTDFPFRKESAGGGVLLDLGVHTLDLLLWWLGDLEVVEYRDNDRGGVESDALARLATPGGGEGTVEFSWTRRLRNTVIVEGERGTMEVALTSGRVRLSPAAGSEELLGTVSRQALDKGFDQRPLDLTAATQRDWWNAVLGEGRPAVSGLEGRRAVSLVRACYDVREPLHLPWMEALACEELVR